MASSDVPLRLLIPLLFLTNVEIIEAPAIEIGGLSCVCICNLHSVEDVFQVRHFLTCVDRSRQ